MLSSVLRRSQCSVCIMFCSDWLRYQWVALFHVHYYTHLENICGLSSADRLDRLICSGARVREIESNVVSASISLKQTINDYGIDGFLNLPINFIYSLFIHHTRRTGPKWIWQLACKISPIHSRCVVCVRWRRDGRWMLDKHTSTSSQICMVTVRPWSLIHSGK